MLAIANVLNVHQTDNQGAIVGLYILFLFIGVGYSYLGIKFSGYLNYFMSMHSTTIVFIYEASSNTNIFLLVYWVGIGTILVVVIMPAMAPTHPSAEWVFTVFQNTTGYKNQGITFLLGMLQAGWCLVNISSIHIP